MKTSPVTFNPIAYTRTAGPYLDKSDMILRDRPQLIEEESLSGVCRAVANISLEKMEVPTPWKRWKSPPFYQGSGSYPLPFTRLFYSVGNPTERDFRISRHTHSSTALFLSPSLTATVTKRQHSM